MRQKIHDPGRSGRTAARMVKITDMERIRHRGNEGAAMTYYCPICGEKMHAVYYGYEVCKWRCMVCGRVWSIKMRGKTGIALEGSRGLVKCRYCKTVMKHGSICHACLIAAAKRK